MAPDGRTNPPELFFEESPLVVLDDIEMTYAVRSITASGQKRPRGAFSRASGVETKHVSALQRMSLVLREGESLGVIGTNGSGKSTLMKVITGQLQPTSGSVYSASTPVMLGVNAALIPQVSGTENIVLGCLAMGMSMSEIETKRPEIVELAGLTEDSLALPLRAYSSGMAARLQFAIATAIDPEILIIDEALNTGDAQFRERTSRRIDELREQAGCVLLVSHSLATIQQMCTRTVWIEQGELVMDGSPYEVCRLYTRYTHHLAKGRPQSAADVLQESRDRLVPTAIEWLPD